MAHFPFLATNQCYSGFLLSGLCVLAAVEKLSSVLNTIAVERDWVVVVADADDNRLRTMNSQMRRIDLLCKLVGPLAIAFIDSASSQIAIIVTGAMSAVVIWIEYAAIARVYSAVPALRASKITIDDDDYPHQRRSWRTQIKNACSSTKTYLTHPAFLPSFALALLYLTVLSFAGQMITYLLALGVSSGIFGLLRGLAALFELSATWLAPKIMERIGPIRAGIWFINWQIFCVGAACLFFWLDVDPTVTVVGTVTAVIASRIGLWGFDLSAQIIVQEVRSCHPIPCHHLLTKSTHLQEVEADLRGSFSSQEFAFQNIFEMLAFASTVVFAKPEQFKYPATISAGAVGLAGILYAAFVRMRRGHLVHLSKCMDRYQRKKGRGWSRVWQEDAGEGVREGDGLGVVA
jgi:solute carrier family 40 (iron-regulated transporter), member 1